MSLRSFTIYDMLKRNATLYGGAPALVCNGQTVTFAQYLRQSEILAGGLAGKNIGKGDRIAILGMNSPRFFQLFGAAAALGAIVVPVNWRLSADEKAHILRDAAPKALAVDANFAEEAGTLLSGDAAVDHLIRFEADPSAGVCLDDLMTGAPAAPADLDDDDPFCLIYTAAVEGKPSGAVLTHGNFTYGDMQTVAVMELTRRDAYINMLPLFHITGLNLSFAVMQAGGKNVIIEKFDEKAVLALTASERITLWGSFPPMLSRLTAEYAAGDYDISCLRQAFGIDQPDNIIPFEEKTGAKFWMLYGQTETTGQVTFSPAMEKPGSAGAIGILSKVRIADDQDRDVPEGEAGEILAQGPLVFKGFWNQEERNARMFRNGWHHTGDLGRLDADGYLWFMGRKPEKELIKPGGENVYPIEVEGVILQHPDVAEVSVIGVPDARFGEGIKAVCALKAGKSLDAKTLSEFVAARIARYKKPRYVEFVAELPKTPDGKIDRAKVKALYGAA